MITTEKRREYEGRRKNLAERNAYRKIWRAAHPEKVRAYAKAYKQRNRAKLSLEQRNRALLKKYGITADQKTAMLGEQGNRCAICGVKSLGLWHVDHDHETGRIRGILCGPCNTGLGCFRDCAEFLQLAAQYLKNPKVPLRAFVGQMLEP